MVKDKLSDIAFQRMKGDILLAFLSTTLFVVTAWFSQATFAPIPSRSGPWKSLSALGVSDTLAVLRLLQSLLYVSTTFVLLHAFDYVLWLLVKRDTGLRTICLLGLSSTTQLYGTFTLLFSKYAKAFDRLVASTKIILISMVWISGIILFLKTAIISVNVTVLHYNVTAGIGSFRGSYVTEYLQNLQAQYPRSQYTVLPYSVIVAASNLVINPTISLTLTPVKNESNKRSDSYLVPGGLLMSTPWPPITYEDCPTITIYDAPATQIDFVRETEHTDIFDDTKDCSLYQLDGFRDGMKFCLAESQTNPGSLVAGIFVCLDIYLNGTCLTTSNVPNITTTFSVYQRHATVTSARSNMSILAVHDLQPPVQQVDLNVEALKQSFLWLTNSTAAGTPAASSLTQYFGSVQDQLGSEYWSIEAIHMFQSLLAFPFWFFNDNNYGNIRLNPETIIGGLPKEFYTYATVDKPLSKILVNEAMFMTFCILQSICLSFIWAVLIYCWLNSTDMPEVSCYPLIDFAMKTEQRQILLEATNELKEMGRGEEPQGHYAIEASATSASIRKILKDDRTVLRRTIAAGVGTPIQYQHLKNCQFPASFEDASAIPK